MTCRPYLDLTVAHFSMMKERQENLSVVYFYIGIA